MYALRSNGESGDILCTHAAEEIERLTLTDEERAAIERAADFIDAKSYASADTLRALLERTRPDA
jgi:hypothetical protein